MKTDICEPLNISVGIVAFNEEDYLPSLLSELKAQDYPKEHTEIILIDSLSTDKTLELFKEFKEENKDDYRNIIVVSNPKRIQAAGWNIAIKEFTLDALIRVDAHAKLPSDFIRRNAECLNSGENVCGGMRPNIARNNSKREKLILLTDNSIFGGSFAKYHSSEEKCYVDSVFHGCYRREVLEKVKGFNEELGRTEDNDFHQRIVGAGYKICYDPHIKSYQYSRGSLKGFFKQKYGNGYWVGKTLRINRNCLSLFHFVPFAFFMATVLCVIFGVLVSWIPLCLLAAAYGAVTVAACVLTVKENRKFTPLLFLLPFMFLSMHLSYGAGTLIGLLSVLKKG